MRKSRVHAENLQILVRSEAELCTYSCCKERTAGSANNCGDGGEEHSRRTTGTADTEDGSTAKSGTKDHSRVTPGTEDHSRATPGTKDHSRVTPGTEDDDKAIQVQRTTVK